MLKVFDGIGAIKLLGEEDGILILERAIPGVILTNYHSSKIDISCRLMEMLHKASIPIKHKFPHVKDWFLYLDRDWNMPECYIVKAHILRDKLLSKSYKEHLLHGDLHCDNILLHDNSWVAIDPKGVIGPAIFEVFAFIIDVEKDTEFVSEFFGYNLQEVREWYFIRAVLSICWNLEDNLDPTKFIRMADRIYPLV